jgi:sarcosine oxidase/L-pipecolate oxidase
LDECRKKWGGCLRESDFEGLKGGYWSPEAGWADAGAAVAAMMKSAVDKGVKYVCGDVESLVLGGKGVRGVKLKDGEVFEADTVLLCTGAWTSALMSAVEDELGIEENARVEKQAMAAGVCCAHFRLTDEEMEGLRDMPIVIYGERGEVLPPPRIQGAGPNGMNLLKYTNSESFSHYVTTNSSRKISVPPDRDQTIVPEQLKQETQNEMVRKAMPQYADRPVQYFRLCYDALTPDQNQLITKHPHPALSNLYFAVGGSFHSWKFLPTIGEYVVNMMSGKGNGEEKDAAWSWKANTTLRKGAHEKVIPKRDLKDLERC